MSMHVGPIQGIGWDLDGVLRQSEEIKIRVFCDTFQEFLKKKGIILSEREFIELTQLRTRLSGLSPAEVFRGVFGKYFPGQIVRKSEYAQFRRTYKQRSAKKVSDLPITQNGKNLIEYFTRKGVPQFVASKETEREVTHWIKRELRKAKLQGSIQNMYGVDTPKEIAICDFCKINQLAPRNILFVGDTLSDVKATQKAGAVPVLFCAKGKPRLTRANRRILRVQSLQDMQRIVESRTIQLRRRKWKLEIGNRTRTDKHRQPRESSFRLRSLVQKSKRY